MRVFFSTYNLQFWLLCLSSYLFFASFNMIIPELPDYLTSLGGEEYKGFIIAVFTLTAGLSRPFSGKLADRMGRIPVMIIGAGVCFFVGFMYPLISSISGFFLLRLIHGFSTGFKPTGTVAYVADIVPLEKRGEALGISGVFGAVGMASGPSIGSEITLLFSLDVMFYCSSAMAILSVLVLIGMKETLPKPEKFKISHLRIRKDEIFDKTAIPPFIVMTLNVFSFGIILTIIPDFSVYLGFENKGTFYTVFTVSSILVRFFVGSVSDRYGREIVLVGASCCYILSMIIIGISTDAYVFLFGAVIFGLGTGMNSPTLFAWTVDLCDDEHKGRAMSSVFIGLELGIMMGAMISGWVYNNESSNFPMTFFTGAMMASISLIYLIVKLKKKKLSPLA